MSQGAFNFTKSALEKLPIPAEGKRLVVRDTQQRGLQLRVTSNGVKTFSVRRMVRGGREERVTIGRFPEMTLEKARREAGTYSREMAEGKSISDLRKAKNSELTFTKLFELYLERHAKSNKRTWQEDQTKFDMHIKSAIGNRKLSTITRREIAGIHSELSQASKPTTANRVLALISSVFGWAAKSGLWDDNPAKGVVRNRETSRDRFLQRDELPRFYAAVMSEPNETIRDFFLMALFTGARRANVLAMHSRELDLEMAEWRIPRTKNDDPQIVTLVPEAVEIVRNRRIPAGGGFVFPGAGREGHLHEPRSAYWPAPMLWGMYAQSALWRAGILNNLPMPNAKL